MLPPQNLQIQGWPLTPEAGTYFICLDYQRRLEVYVKDGGEAEEV